MSSTSWHSTYRLQLHDGFTFADARAIVPYLADLRISHLYLSPILQAASGSLHGYDVIDHSAVASGLGGLEGFEALVGAAREHGLGVIVDTVPNHMAFAEPAYLNRPLWEVLRRGPKASTAHWFDIDWAAGEGRLGLPMLGQPVADAVANGELRLGAHEGQPVVRYHDQLFPLAEGTAPESGAELDTAAMLDLLEAQHYRLADWRDKDEVLNYRRFFEVDKLIAVRVEDPDVFDATHALLLEAHHRGLIDGFRVDHPDGLADPLAYLERLRDAVQPGTPIWVEKILIGDEPLPADWPTAGTTGYDALRAITGALVDATPKAADAVRAAWEDDAGGEPSLHVVERASKRDVLELSFRPETARLARRAGEARPDLDAARLAEATFELLAAAEVYRAYIRPGRPVPDRSRELLDRACGVAAGERPDLAAELDALVGLARLDGPVAGGSEDAATDFAIRLQQTWGPVMAKGVEDTTFYRYHRMIALNEVGGDPDLLTTGGPDVLHDWAVRQQAHWPQGLVALSTHDTKRSEDARARILAVAGDPEAWRACSALAHREAHGSGIDGPTVHLVWQTLLGTMPIEAARLEGYLTKALREAKQHTGWLAPDVGYEQEVLDFAQRHRAAGPLHDALRAALDDNAEAITALTLGQQVLQLTLPGVPDTYQGCEAVDLSLVDPDNRRPVDYPTRADLLGRLTAAAPASTTALAGPTATERLSASKLRLVTALLALRQERPELFDADATYQPRDTGSEHLIAFARAAGDGPPGLVVALTRAPGALARSGGWTDQCVELPDGDWVDVVTGATRAGGPHECRELFAQWPVAVLLRRGETAP